jgi:hypothetical protein
LSGNALWKTAEQRRVMSRVITKPEELGDAVTLDRCEVLRRRDAARFLHRAGARLAGAGVSERVFSWFREMRAWTAPKLASSNWLVGEPAGAGYGLVSGTWATCGPLSLAPNESVHSSIS